MLSHKKILSKVTRYLPGVNGAKRNGYNRSSGQRSVTTHGFESRGRSLFKLTDNKKMSTASTKLCGAWNFRVVMTGLTRINYHTKFCDNMTMSQDY